MDEETKKRAQFLVDWALKMRTMMLLPDEFLAWVGNVESHPTPEKLAALEKWCLDAGEFIERRVAEHLRRANELPQQQPSQPEIIGRQYLN